MNFDESWEKKLWSFFSTCRGLILSLETFVEKAHCKKYFYLMKCKYFVCVWLSWNYSSNQFYLKLLAQTRK